MKRFLQERLEMAVFDFGAAVLSSTARWHRAAMTVLTGHSVGDLALAIAPRSPARPSTSPRDSVGRHRINPPSASSARVNLYCLQPRPDGSYGCVLWSMWLKRPTPQFPHLSNGALEYLPRVERTE